MPKIEKCMEIETVSMKDVEENCRMCLENMGKFVVLESTFECSTTDQTYWDAYNFCTNLNGRPDDCLPNVVCLECAENIRFVFDVIKKAIHSDQVLRDLLEKQLHLEKLNEAVEEYDEEQVVKEEIIEQNIDSNCPDNEMEEVVYLQDAIDTEIDDTDSQRDFLLDAYPVQPFSSDDEKHSPESVTSYDAAKEKPEKINLAKKPTKKTRKKTSTEKNAICEVCGKCFSSNQKVKIHALVHTKEKNFPCNLCPKRFSTIFRHREHMRTHSNHRPHECSFCKKAFFSKHTLVCHLRRHTGERPYKCEICGKSFTQNSIMKTHAALHTGKTVECPHCFKKFSRPSHLILHQRSHTGERPYACSMCPNSYKQKSHLDRHLDTHMGVKHTCETCGKEYSKKSSLNAHMFVHAETKPYKCEVCSMEFATKDKCQRHFKNTHKPITEEEPAKGTDCALEKTENSTNS